MKEHATGEDNAEVADLYRAYRARLVRYAARWTRTPHDAEDAVQEAFMFALGAYAEVNPTNPRAWMYAVTRYRALEMARTGAATVPASDIIEDQATPALQEPACDDAPTMADPDTALYVLAALDLLPPRQREALALWALEGLSWAEVAERMNIKRGSARHAAYTSLRQLRES